MSQTFGKIVADGDAAFIALVRQALDEAKNGIPLPDLYENLPPRTFTVSQHTPAEMVDNGAIIPGSRTPLRPDGVAAYGKVFDRNDLWLNARIARTQPHLARHVIRHEIAHTLPTGTTRQSKLLQLMWKPNGRHPRAWYASDYIMRPEECRADTLAEAVSGIDSPWDEFKYYGLDVRESDFAEFVAVHFEQPPAPEAEPAPQPEPEPLPLPDPRVVELEAKNAELVGTLATIARTAHEAVAPTVEEPQ